MPEPVEDSMTVQAAADRLGLQFRTIYYLVDRGELPAEVTLPTPRPKSRRRTIRIRRQDVDDYIERARVKPGELRHLNPPAEGRYRSRRSP